MAKKNVTELNTSGCKPRSVKYSSTNSKYFKTISPVPIKPSSSSSSETVRLSPASPSAGGGGGGGGVIPYNNGGLPSPKNNPSSPRTSPGLLAGHYAGCKFTEPPLPSALPLPPQHWMQQGRPRVVSLLLRPKEILKTTTVTSTITTTPAAPANDFFLSQQLKMLLKVQA